MFLAGHPSQGCFGLQSHCAPCYFFNQASFYPSDFSFSLVCSLILAGLLYGERQVPVTTKRTTIKRHHYGGAGWLVWGGIIPGSANIVDEYLQSEDITRMDWPAYSSDLNPIEHVWDMLGR
ncbi:DDE_3 domain-containing protein [Trichonephila clavipes]|nr:DDE_3 domain-containing protein [Trichonephila clavipes]